ncbi:hypothetical protein Bbelb_165290 [Branchiostoma belcheri]|nr:hypothetical protein Bbelb_165290 [Branchiostoma belcheri]
MAAARPEAFLRLRPDALVVSSVMSPVMVTSQLMGRGLPVLGQLPPPRVPAKLPVPCRFAAQYGSKIAANKTRASQRALAGAAPILARLSGPATCRRGANSRPALRTGHMPARRQFSPGSQDRPLAGAAPILARLSGPATSRRGANSRPALRTGHLPARRQFSPGSQDRPLPGAAPGSQDRPLPGAAPILARLSGPATSRRGTNSRPALRTGHFPARRPALRTGHFPARRQFSPGSQPGTGYSRRPMVIDHSNRRPPPPSGIDETPAQFSAMAVSEDLAWAVTDVVMNALR